MIAAVTLTLFPLTSPVSLAPSPSSCSFPFFLLLRIFNLRGHPTPVTPPPLEVTLNKEILLLTYCKVILALIQPTENCLCEMLLNPFNWCISVCLSVRLCVCI